MDQVWHTVELTKNIKKTKKFSNKPKWLSKGMYVSEKISINECFSNNFKDGKSFSLVLNLSVIDLALVR